MALGFSLIAAIGAQNAFVLQQGLKRQHALLTAAICVLCDALLIGVGVAGMGQVIAQSVQLRRVALWGGILFLGYYGARSLFSAYKPGALRVGQMQPLSRAATVRNTLAVSLLNPHVYLDTVVLLGGVGGRFAGASKTAFALGGMSASSLWFFALALGAFRFAPLLKKPSAWRVLDLMIAGIMFLTAFLLFREVL